MTEKTAKKSLNTQELKAALRQKYCSDARGSAIAYAMLEEVRSETGYSGHGRYADALVMSLWPSRGLELFGFEIKASRSDWVKELEHPEKAEPIFQYCDRWYLVAGSDNIVKPGELPPTWGLMLPRGQQLVIKTEAPKLEPQPITREFLASIFRSTAREIDIEPQLKQACDSSYEAGYKTGKEQGLKFGSSAGATLAKFEETSGIKLDRAWEAGDIGAAVKRVMAAEHLKIKDQLQWHRKAMERILGSIDAALQEEKHEDPT